MSGFSPQAASAGDAGGGLGGRSGAVRHGARAHGVAGGSADRRLSGGEGGQRPGLSSGAAERGNRGTPRAATVDRTPELGVPNFSDWRMLVLLVAVCFSAVLVPYLIGRRLRDADISTVERARAAQDRYVSELVAREERSRTIEARVRNDIARELHDVVAHSLSVIIVQAEGGKAMARKNPAVGAQTLDTIAETGREALSQMRRVVGVLRAGPDGSEWAPQPGLDDIAELVTRAGSRVSLKVHGAQPTVPATVGLATYRVVQEALTNFFKHAGPRASCRVEISYTEATIKLDIIDNGDGSKAFNDGVGNGVKGMRERVTAAGGELSARARRTGGFQVSAVLPTRTDEGTAPLS